jgi:hypothetical protein
MKKSSFTSELRQILALARPNTDFIDGRLVARFVGLAVRVPWNPSISG